MDKIIVGIAERKVARENQVFTSRTLGFYVGIYLYNHRERTAGMAHVILPERKYSIYWDNAYKSIGEGIHELINQIREQGAWPVGLIAKIAGGARMFGAPSGTLDTGQQDAVAVRECLAQKGVRLVAQHIGQNYGRAILFYIENGRPEVNTVRHSAVVL